MRRVGVEPTVFLMWGIYSPLPSPLGIPTHIVTANYDLANLSYSPCYYTRRTTTILLRMFNHSATSIIIFKKINGLLSAPKLEHWVGVEPTNVGFADQPSTDGDPTHND